MKGQWGAASGADSPARDLGRVAGRRAARGLVALAAVALSLGWFPAASWAEGPNAEPKAPAAAAAAAEDGSDIVDRDFYFISDDLIRNKNGTLTWLYATNHVSATTLKKSIDQMKIQGLVTATRTTDEWVFKLDARFGVDIRNPPTKREKPDDNVLILTFPPAYKDIVEEWLQRFDVPEPQVYIKAKVVEVSLDSNLEYGVSWFFDRGGGDPSTGEIGSANPNAFFRAFRSQFRPGSFSGGDVLSPSNTGLSLLFDDLTTDEGTLIATIEALQERGSANILSEPSVLATQGQIARLVTGQETPVQEITIRGSSETITTKFKQTGIELNFRPLHVGREYVKMRVYVETSSITGFLTTQTATTSIQNPIIATRSAGTVVTIRDGMTLVIGGLYALSEVEDRTGVPILADIPILKYLFSRKKKTKVKSEVDFFITPYILRQRLAKSVFTPPMEKDRLKRMKDQREGK
jgi:type II secretory pathway component GspD/PulD (secretin)